MTHYSLTFNTTAGSRRTMRINNPTIGLPMNEIENAAGQMVANDIFDAERGGLESLSRMELITMERATIL